VLVSAHDGAVDHRVFVVGLGREMLKDPLPYAGFRPAAEPAVDIDRIAEAFRQVTPGDAGPVAVQHGVDEPAVIGGGRSDRTFSSGQKVLDPVPLVVTKSKAAHGSAPQS